MKRTFTINLNNSIFNIDEDAYNVLQNYLTSLKNHFSKEEGGDEILQDIENRISEIFKTKTSTFKEVITISDVNSIIETLGKPEFIIENDSENQEKKSSTQEKEEFRKTRRIYRDVDNRVIGGVCSGLGSYFDIDPVIFRILMVITFFMGAGPLIYLVLWIAIPKAITTAQKLEMRGEKVNVSNIEKSIREELNDVKENFKKYKSSGNFDHAKETGHKFLDFLTVFFHGIFKFVLLAVGIALIFVGIILLIGFSGSFMIDDWGINNISFPGFLNLFASEQSVFFGSIGLFLLISVILLSIIYGGIKLIFNIKGRNRIISITGSVIWLIGLFLIIYVSVVEGLNFKAKASNSQTEIISTKCDTLFLKSANLSNFECDEDFSDEEFSIGKSDSKDAIGMTPRVDIVKSDSQNFEISIQKKSRGRNRSIALNNAKKIDYLWNTKDSLLVLDKHYLIPENTKFRVQQMKITVKVPVGKSIFIDENMIEIIHETQNIENFEDFDVVGKMWKMEEDGLVLVK